MATNKPQEANQPNITINNIGPQQGPHEQKDWLTALLLSIFLGYWGVDRFYMGHTGLGLLKLFTFGLCGILYIIDIIMIATGSLKDAYGQPLIKK